MLPGRACLLAAVVGRKPFDPLLDDNESGKVDDVNVVVLRSGGITEVKAFGAAEEFLAVLMKVLVLRAYRSPLLPFVAIWPPPELVVDFLPLEKGPQTPRDVD